MIQENYRKQDVDRLVQQLREDELDEMGQAALRDIIRNHPEARRRVARQLYMEAHLREAIGLAASSKKGRISNEGIRWNLLLMALGVVCVLGGLYWVFQRSDGLAEDSTAVDSPNIIPPGKSGVAVMRIKSGLIWKDEPPRQLMQQDGRSMLEPCVLEIESGVLQVDFYSGATVLLEGPVKFEIVGPDLGKIYYGKLSVKVPPPAINFRVMAKRFEVAEHGIELGVSLDEQGFGEIHLFEGEIEVLGGNGEREPLKTGQALILTPNGMKTGAVDPSGFVRSQVLDERARYRMKEWRELRDRLANDPAVIVYYTFSDFSDWKRSIPNEAKFGPDDTDGAVVGCFGTKGRWPGKRALGFENSSNRVRLNLPGLFSNLTFSTWLRVDDFHAARVSLLNPEGEQLRYCHWNLVTSREKGLPQTPVHLHFSETSHPFNSNTERGPQDRRHYHAPTALGKLFASGKWVHLALVYDAEAQEVKHFANGKLVYTNPIKKPRFLGIGVSDIGNWPYKKWAEGTDFEVRNLDGAIDEFLIAKRVFTNEEIQEIYEKGRP